MPPPTEKLRLLAGSGFHISLEIQKWQHNGPDNIPLSITQSAEMARAFYLEYLARSPILPIPLASDGHRFFPTHDPGHAWLDNISPKERSGATLAAAAETERLFHELPIGHAVLFTSPPGNSGLADELGRPIRYAESQTYVFLNTASGLQASTLVTSMTLAQSETLLARYSDFTPHPVSPTADRERAVAAKAFTIAPPPGKHLQLADIVDNIWENMGCPATLRGTVTHDQLQAIARNYPAISAYPDQVEAALHRFESQAQTITDLDPASVWYASTLLHSLLTTIAGPTPVIALSGCAGGGLLDSFFGPRFVRNCGNCGVSINRNIAKKYVCPACGGIYEGC